MGQSTATLDETTRRGVRTWIVKSAVFSVIYALALFVSAGRWLWLWGWIVILTKEVNQIVLGSILVKRQPDLIAERSQVQEGAKWWDIGLALVIAWLAPVGMVILAGLDQRHGWSGSLPLLAHLGGWIVAVLGLLLTNWAMIANRFFSGLVRVQEDRGQRVISRGPYAWVRHPGYVGALLYYLGTPLALGSWVAYVATAMVTVVLVVRTALEDRTLQQELDGYAAYTEGVRYRLLPGVW